MEKGGYAALWSAFFRKRFVNNVTLVAEIVFT